MVNQQTNPKSAGYEYFAQSVIALLLLVIAVFCWMSVFAVQFHTKGWAYWVMIILFWGVIVSSVVSAVRGIKGSWKLIRSEKRILNYLAFGISGMVVTLIIVVFSTVIINQ